MLIPLNWLKGMNCDILSVTAYQSVTKINGLLTLHVHSISVPIERYSPHTLQLKGERSS